MLAISPQKASKFDKFNLPNIRVCFQSPKEETDSRNVALVRPREDWLVAGDLRAVKSRIRLGVGVPSIVIVDFDFARLDDSLNGSCYYYGLKSIGPLPL